MTPAYRYRPSLGSRAAAAGLSLAICALIILALIRMGWLDQLPGGPGSRLTAVTFRAQSADHAEHKAAKQSVQKQAEATTVRPQVTPTPVQPRPPVVPPLNIIKLTHDEFAASDISKLGKRDSSAGQTSGTSASAYGPGEGPGGARLYNAEWYREPTRAEMITYMPHRDVAGGWAMIACKTLDHYHVEDCQELGESPQGSGLARALRQASWQFLVRPPRLDGKPMIGAWVRIRFDFTRAKEGDAPDGG